MPLRFQLLSQPLRIGYEQEIQVGKHICDAHECKETDLSRIVMLWEPTGGVVVLLAAGPARIIQG
jgi:hypothetical protein